MTEEKRQNFTILKTENEKVQIIIENILKMLSNRVYFKSGQAIKLLDMEKAKKDMETLDDNVFIFKASNGDLYAVKIVFQKITTTGKQSPITDFINDYPKHNKIIIANEYNNKIADYVNKQSIQIFRESALLSDLISHCYQPKFEVLSPSEIEITKKEYNFDDSTIKKILKSDPVTKYYGLKKGNMLRITRPSPLSGFSIDYRIVA